MMKPGAILQGWFCTALLLICVQAPLGAATPPAATTNAEPESLIFYTHDRVVFSVGFSPGGEMLAAASLDGAVSIWGLQGLLHVKARLHTRMVFAVAFSPDGKRLASASGDGTIAIFDRDGTLQKRLTGHSTNIAALAWAPDGNMIASGSEDKRVIIHNTDGSIVKTLSGQMQSITALEFTPDGRQLVVSERGQHVVVYDTRTWKSDKLIKAHTDVIWDVAIAPDGKSFATASKDRTIGIHRLDGTRLAEIGGFSGEIWTLAWSPDGTKIACGLRTGELVIADVATKSIVRTLRSHETGIPAIAWSPTGRIVATGSRDGTIRMWRGL